MNIFVLAIEPCALKTGLEFALDDSFYPLIVESDCLEEVNLVNKQEYSFAADGIIVGEIQDLLSQMNIFEIYFRPRECNAVAHTITTFIVQSGGLFFWLEEGPFGS